MTPRCVLAIDDDPTQLELLGAICDELEYPPVELLTATTAKEGMDLLKRRAVDVVLTDYRLPDMTGLEVVQAVQRLNPLVAVVVITAYKSAEEAVEILKSGADDYLVKPTKPEQIEHVLIRSTERQNLQRETEELQEEIAEDFQPEFITFRSRNMAEALNIARRSAGSTASVLIRGESGTGKELVAKVIHNASMRSEKPFVTVNVAALPEALVESELFGHVKGAFTGAVSDRKGRFEEAHGGTLFIDEVGDITPAVQVKLLRAIQFGEVQRVGSNEAVQLDVRIIAATNRDLEGMIEDGGFREDLYYRLNVIEIPLPPLRERKTDIPLLVDQFIRRYAETNGKEIKGITFQALDILMKYEFPGNIRELENTIERSVILCRGDRITVHDLPSGLVRAAGRPQPDELGSEGPAARGSTATAAQAVPNGDEVQQNSAGCGEMPAQAGEGRGGGASAGRPVGGSDHAPPGSNQTPGGSETHPDHAAGAHSSLDDILSEKEAELILAALARSQGNQSRAAQELGISERKLRSRMERLGLENTFAQAR